MLILRKTSSALPKNLGNFVEYSFKYIAVIFADAASHGYDNKSIPRRITRRHQESSESSNNGYRVIDEVVEGEQKKNSTVKPQQLKE